MGSFFQLPIDPDFWGLDGKSRITVALPIHLYCQKDSQVVGQEDGFHGLFSCKWFWNKSYAHNYWSQDLLFSSINNIKIILITNITICLMLVPVNNYLCASFHVTLIVSLWGSHPIFIFRWGTKNFKICSEPHSSITSIQIWLLTANDKFSFCFSGWEDHEVGKWHVVCIHLKFSFYWHSLVGNNSYPLLSLSCPCLKIPSIFIEREKGK